jgi:hypothetical protein
MFFLQPLDQFDLYLVNSTIINQFFPFDLINYSFLNFNFLGLIFFLFLLFFVFFILTAPVFFNKLRLVPSTI